MSSGYILKEHALFDMEYQALLIIPINTEMIANTNNM